MRIGLPGERNRTPLFHDLLQQRLHSVGVGHNLASVVPVEHHGRPAVTNGPGGQLDSVLSDFLARVFPSALECAIDDRREADGTTAFGLGRQYRPHPHQRRTLRLHPVAEVGPAKRITREQ